MRRRPILLGVVALALLATSAVLPLRHWLVWNASASLPTGLYLIRGRASLHPGERVAITPPSALARMMAARSYLPLGVPLLKRVAAVSGQNVCRFANTIMIDGQLAAIARRHDSRGRSLPVWQGCHRLGSRELFVLNPAAPDSFDGRYFGVTHLDQVIGRALPVWTDERGGGGHQLFARAIPDARPNPQDRSRP